MRIPVIANVSNIKKKNENIKFRLSKATIKQQNLHSYMVLR